MESGVTWSPPSDAARRLPGARWEARERIFALVVVAGAAAVFFMWAHDTLFPHDAGAWLVAVGRVTGLEGTYAALVTVLLLARVWWIERLVAMDRLFVWHRIIGQGTIALLCAHALFIVWGYSASFHTSFLGEVRYQVLDLPDVLLATVALAMLIVVGVMSMRRIRFRLQYQTWYFIHLYTYVALALSFAHQFATGADFASHPLNRELWASLYVVVFALLVWYRAVVPLRSSWRHQLRVDRVVAEGPGSASVYVSGRSLDRLRAVPGQFFIWRFLTPEGWWQAHPFSLSAPPLDDALRLTIRDSGDFTHEIGRLAPGTRVIAEGPFGSFTARRRRRRKVLLVAAGAGIAPVRSLFETLDGDVTLLYRARDEPDMALRHELEEIAARSGSRLICLPGSRREHPETSDPAALVELIGPDLAEYDVFICGPRGFMAETERALVAAGVPRRHVVVELFET